MREEETEGSPIERKRYGVPFAGRGASVEQGRDGMKAGGLLRAIKIAEARCKVDALDCPEVMDLVVSIWPLVLLLWRKQQQQHLQQQQLRQLQLQLQQHQPLILNKRSKEKTNVYCITHILK